jgi:DNA-binding beta-propeller fold protein YncE
MNPIRASLALCSCLMLSGCQGSSGAGASNSGAGPRGVHSSSLALSSDGHTLFVANPEADSVSVLDVQARMLTSEISLAALPPAADPISGDYAPTIMPRAVALSADATTLYVTAERSGALLVVDIASGHLRQSVPVGSEPVGLVVADGSIYVACSQDATVVRVDAKSLQITATAHVPNEPWALAFSADGTQLLVTHLMGPGVTEIDVATMTVKATWPIPDTAPRGDRRLAHGQVRGLYDVVSRPGTSELWVAHALLGTDTAQPTLDFESTAFPALSLLHDDGTYEQTLSTDAEDVPGIDGSFANVVSGPHAIAFTPDGDYLLMVDTNSEDVLVVDAATHIQTDIVRPLPGKMPEGIVLSADGTVAYVDERVSGDVAVLRLDRSSGTLKASVDGAPIPRWSSDPMPATLRLGQALFNSANSTQYPITTDHWIACATCHMEGRSDAVTWLFAQGPRDTPTNAGGMLGTGFLFRTADRNQVQDYWHTINVEQGGRFDPTAQSSLLDALTAYVNHALPLPLPPTTDAALVARGAQVFNDSGCGTCHSGDRFTDSGSGNPTLDLAGTVLLHDIGTCVTSAAFPDVAHEDVAGDPRAACAFDTPSLNGVASTPPYLHDGSAATLADAIAKMPNAPTSADDVSALVEYLRSL